LTAKAAEKNRIVWSMQHITTFETISVAFRQDWDPLVCIINQLGSFICSNRSDVFKDEASAQEFMINLATQFCNNELDKDNIKEKKEMIKEAGVPTNMKSARKGKEAANAKAKAATKGSLKKRAGAFHKNDKKDIAPADEHSPDDAMEKPAKSVCKRPAAFLGPLWIGVKEGFVKKEVSDEVKDAIMKEQRLCKDGAVKDEEGLKDDGPKDDGLKDDGLKDDRLKDGMVMGRVMRRRSGKKGEPPVDEPRVNFVGDDAG
jgi:hypothetical protein